MPGFDVPDQVMMQIMPGVQILVPKSSDFLLAAGYTHCFLTKGGGSEGHFTVKAGINLHKNPWKQPKVPKVPVPTRNRGV